MPTPPVNFQSCQRANNLGKWDLNSALVGAWKVNLVNQYFCNIFEKFVFGVNLKTVEKICKKVFSNKTARIRAKP